MAMRARLSTGSGSGEALAGRCAEPFGVFRAWPFGSLWPVCTPI